MAPKKDKDKKWGLNWGAADLDNAFSERVEENVRENVRNGIGQGETPIRSWDDMPNPIKDWGEAASENIQRRAQIVEPEVRREALENAQRPLWERGGRHFNPEEQPIAPSDAVAATVPQKREAEPVESKYPAVDSNTDRLASDVARAGIMQMDDYINQTLVRNEDMSEGEKIVASRHGEKDLYLTPYEANMKYVPSQIVDNIVDNLDTPLALSNIRNNAAALNVTESEYVEKILLPVVENKVREELVRRKMPKNAIDAALSPLRQSIIGRILQNTAGVPSEIRGVEQEAQARYDEKLREEIENGGAAERVAIGSMTLGRMAVPFIADAGPFKLLGAVSNVAGLGRLANASMLSGNEFMATAARVGLREGGTFGLYEGISGLLDDAVNDEVKWYQALKNFVLNTVKGTAKGVGLGVIRAGLGKYYEGMPDTNGGFFGTAQTAGRATVGFMTEAGWLAAADVTEKYIENPATFNLDTVDWKEELLNSGLTVMMMKLSAATHRASKDIDAANIHFTEEDMAAFRNAGIPIAREGDLQKWMFQNADLYAGIPKEQQLWYRRAVGIFENKALSVEQKNLLLKKAGLMGNIPVQETTKVGDVGLYTFSDSKGNPVTRYRVDEFDGYGTFKKRTIFATEQEAQQYRAEIEEGVTQNRCNFWRQQSETNKLSKATPKAVEEMFRRGVRPEQMIEILAKDDKALTESERRVKEAFLDVRQELIDNMEEPYDVALYDTAKKYGVPEGAVRGLVESGLDERTEFGKRVMNDFMQLLEEYTKPDVLDNQREESVARELIPEGELEQLREEGRKLYASGDAKAMHEQVLRYNAAKARHEGSRSDMQLLEYYLRQKAIYDAMLETHNGNHSEAYRTAENIAKNELMADPDGNVRVVRVGDKAFVVLNADMDSMIVAPVETAEDGSIDFASADRSRARSMMRRDAGEFEMHNVDEVMRSMYPTVTAERDAIFGDTKPEVGQVIETVADEQGNVVRETVAGTDGRGTWMLQGEDGSQRAVTEEDLTKMLREQEQRVDDERYFKEEVEAIKAKDIERRKAEAEERRLNKGGKPGEKAPVADMEDVPVPRDQEGKADLNGMAEAGTSVANAIDALNEAFGGDLARAQRVVAAKVKALSKQSKEVSEPAGEESGDLNAMADAARERNAQRAKIAREQGYWLNLLSEMTGRRKDVLTKDIDNPDNYRQPKEIAREQMEKLAEKLGVKVVFTDNMYDTMMADESITDKPKDALDAEGYNGYRRKDGTIVVNMNSEHAMVWTMGHETGHQVEAASPQQYEVLKAAVLETLDPLFVAQKMESLRGEEVYKNSTDSELLSEIANDGLGRIFTDERAFGELMKRLGVEEAKTLADKIKSWVGQTAVMKTLKQTWDSLTQKAQEANSLLMDGERGERLLLLAEAAYKEAMANQDLGKAGVVEPVKHSYDPALEIDREGDAKRLPEQIEETKRLMAVKKDYEKGLQAGRKLNWRSLGRGGINEISVYGLEWGLNNRILGHRPNSIISEGADGGRVKVNMSPQNLVDTRDHIDALERLQSEYVTIRKSPVVTDGARRVIDSNIYAIDYAKRYYDLALQGDNVILKMEAPQFSKEEAEPKEVEKHPIFLSNAEVAVRNIKQDKATAEQWLAMAEKMGGIKAGEDKWMGLSDWLRSKKGEKLTKDEVLKYIMDNSIQVEDVDYREVSWDDVALLPKMREYAEEFRQRVEEEGDPDAAYEQMVSDYDDDFALAFYNDEGNLYPTENSDGNISDAARYYLDIDNNPINTTRLEYTTKGLKNKREIALVVPDIEPYHGDYREIHFDDNATGGRALAWARFGDSETGDGERVIVVDEVQSQRFEDAKKRGGLSPVGLQAKIRRFTELERKLYSPDGLTIDEGEELQKMRADGVGAASRTEFVPDAPFARNWHELAMKRMLRFAAENGYDKLAWTTGDQQAERYALGGVVDEIDSYTNDDGSRHVMINMKNDKALYCDVDGDGKILSTSGHTDGIITVGQSLGDVIGKELAQKVINGEGEITQKWFVDDREVRKLSGEDLRLGGEGMKGFYDEILPRFMNKYGKKWGVKVYDIELPNVEEAGRHMWAVDITPEMKESVMGGQPMFSKEGRRKENKAQLDLFGDPQLDLFRDRRSVNDRIKTMDDGALLRAIGEGERRDWDFYQDEYDRRHDTEYKDEAAAYSDILEQDGTSLDDAYGMYGNVYRRWVDGGYATEERTKLRAQSDVLADYIYLKEEEEDGGVSFSKEERPEVLASLEKGKTIKVYRAIRVAPDGTLNSPMAGGGVGGGRKAERVGVYMPEFGVWEKADEHPELATYNDGDEYGHITIDKGEGDGTLTVAYNPYIHTSRQMLNDQFSSAWKRPGLQVMEVEVPVSELTSGYKAELAKNAVGESEWKEGPVSKLLPEGKKRMVILSRWDKPVRIVPVEEYAKAVKAQLDGTDIEGIPFNTVTPEQREALMNEGVKILAPENNNAGKASMQAYEEWKRRNAEVQGFEGYTSGDILDYVRGEIEALLDEADIDVKINGMALNGSRMRGDASKGSDLDVVVEYDGKISEDGLFNILNENPIVLEGVTVDINPITKGKSGTLEQYMERSRKYDEEQGAVKFSKEEEENLKVVNKRFNEDLTRYEHGTMTSNEYLNIGTPVGVVARFMPNVPIILRQKVLTKALKKHGLSASSVRNLPQSLPSPIFVFQSSANTISILTELQDSNNRNIFVAIELNTNKQLGHKFIEINDVLTVHGREVENVVYPIIEKNSLVWVDKEKGQNWLSSAKSNSQAITNNDLISAAKIIRNFKNPKLLDENFSKEDKKSQIHTENFKKWFGDWENEDAIEGEEVSVMRNTDGTPKVYYHNTNSDFSVFDRNKSGQNDAGWLGDGFYFYGDENEGNGYGRKQMAVYLNIRNPYYITQEEVRELSEANDREKSVAFTERLKEEGYDGVCWNGDLRDEVVAFYPEQIKSANENRGDFNPENPDIRFSKEAPAPKDGEDWKDYAGRVSRWAKYRKEGLADSQIEDLESIRTAIVETDTEPTEAEKKSGNYKMGHAHLDGYQITIENPAGSVRRGTDPDGKAWETEMHYTYGYIRGTKGKDGDHIDIFLSENPTKGNVYVVDQVEPKTGQFDEHKVMYGFGSKEEAREAYLSNYEEGWKGLGDITGVSKEAFRKWVDSSTRKTKPFAEYAGIEKLEEPAFSKENKLEELKKKRGELIQKRTKLLREGLKLGFFDKTKIQKDVKNVYKEIGDVDSEIAALEGMSATKETAFSKEDEKKIVDAAVKHFGITNDIREAGYVLADGRMLDFSGRHLLDPGTDSNFLKGGRTSDHRTISEIAYAYDENGEEVKTGTETSMPDFIRMGNIRVDTNAGSINLSQKPTKEQKDVLRRIILKNGGDVTVDFGDGWDSAHYAEYEGAKSNRVLADIDRYFDENIKPEGNVQFSKEDFSIKDEKTSENDLQIGEKFVSLHSERDKEAVREQRSSMPPTAQWREGVGDVVMHTILPVVRKKYAELHAKAKAGDREAAAQLVEAVVKEDRVKSLVERYPNAKVAFVHAEEATGTNVIPDAYADAFVKYGLGYADIIQTNKPQHTGSDRIGRLLRRARFDGDVEAGGEYIIVDDHVTMGGTLRDLKDYIESKGGKVVSVTTLTASAGGSKLQPTVEQIEQLKQKGITNEQLKELGIADDIAGLTKGEARELLVLADARADRRDAQGRSGDNGVVQRAQGEASSFGQGVEFSKEEDFAERYSGGSEAKKAQIASGVGKINAIREKFGDKSLLSDKDLVSLHTEFREPMRQFYEAVSENIANEYVNEIYASGRNVIDPDELRARAFGVVGYDGTNVSLYGENDNLIVNVYKKALAKAIADNNPTVILLTGHAGAGKSTALKTSGIDTSGAGVVYDSAFNTPESLARAIDTAKAAGIKESDIRVVAVYNDPVTSFSNTLARARKEGRTVPFDYFFGHAFIKNDGKLRIIAEDYPEAKLICLDNSGNSSKGEVSPEEAKNWNYEVSEQQFEDALKLLEDEINREEGGLTEHQIASITRGLSGTEKMPDKVRRMAEGIEVRIRQNSRRGSVGEVGRELVPAISSEAPAPKEGEGRLEYAQRVMAWQREKGKGEEPQFSKDEDAKVKQGKSEAWKNAYDKVKDKPHLRNILLDLEPHTIEEVAAGILRGGGLLWGDVKDSEGKVLVKGVRSFMGYKEGERKKFFGLFTSEENGGRGFERVGEEVETECQRLGIPYDENDPMAGVNALQSVLSECGGKGQLDDYIQYRRVLEVSSQIKADEDAEREALDEEYYDRYGMDKSTYDQIFEEVSGEKERRKSKETIDLLQRKVEQQNDKMAKMWEELKKARLDSESRKIAGVLSRQLQESERQNKELRAELSERRNDGKKLDNTRIAMERRENIRKQLIDYIREQVASEWMPFTTKQDLNRLMSAVQQATTPEALEKAMRSVQYVSMSGMVRAQQQRLDRLMALKVQDVNGKNMSIAKNVDDRTRFILQGVRQRVLDNKMVSLLEQLDGLRRDRIWFNAGLRKMRQRGEAPEVIAKEEAKLQRNAERMADLEQQIEDIREQKPGTQESDIQSEIAELNEKADKAATGDAVWTTEDADMMTQLQLMQALVEPREYTVQEARIGRELSQEIDKVKELVARRNAVTDDDVRRDLADEIKTKREKIEGLQDARNEAQKARSEALSRVIELFQNTINGGKESLQAKVQAEAERRMMLIREAVRSVGGGKGVSDGQSREGQRQQKNATRQNVVVETISAPLGSFDYMCQKIDTEGGQGKDGWIYRRFVSGEEGAMEAYNTYLTGVQEQMDALNKKVNELFGAKRGLMGTDAWVMQAAEADKVVENCGVTHADSKVIGKRVSDSLSKGQATYIWAVWQMPDGKLKLKLQGYDEESIREIEKFIGPKYIELAKWLSSEFFANSRAKYNERYREMYNTSMARIENYVPLKVNDMERRNESALEDPSKGAKSLEVRTGSLINRKFNVVPVDVTNSIFDIVTRHVEQMENWYAYARLRRDLDAVLSNNYFRNQVNANAAGDLDRLYKAAEVATLSYVPEKARYDALTNFLNKGLIAGSIAYRLNTALKQFLSAPANLGYSGDPRYLMALAKNTVTGALGLNLKWCYNNIPSFRKRVDVGDLGDNRWSEESNEKVTQWLQRYASVGMLPNRLIDAITCSIGIKSIYDYSFAKATKGLADSNLTLMERAQLVKEAEKRAKMEADIYYNQTQQSSHPVFLSPMQMERTTAARLWTVFQNSNLGYTRKMMEHAWDLWRHVDYDKFTSAYKRMYLQNGMTKEEAEHEAKMKYWRSLGGDFWGLALYCYGMKLLWNAGSKGLLGFLQNDDDDKKKAGESEEGFQKRRRWETFNDVATWMFTPLQGTPMGRMGLEVAGGATIGGGGSVSSTLFVDAMAQMLREIRAADLDPMLTTAILGKYGAKVAGVDFQTWGNIYIGVEGLVKDGYPYDDKLIDIMYILNTPRSGRMEAARTLFKEYRPNATEEEFQKVVGYADGFMTHDSWLAKYMPGVKDAEGERYAKEHKTLSGEYQRMQNGPAPEKEESAAVRGRKAYRTYVRYEDIAGDADVENWHQRALDVKKKIGESSKEIRELGLSSSLTKQLIDVEKMDHEYELNIADFYADYNKKRGALIEKLTGDKESDQSVLADIRRLREDFLSTVKDKDKLADKVWDIKNE